MMYFVYYEMSEVNDNECDLVACEDKNDAELKIRQLLERDEETTFRVVEGRELKVGITHVLPEVQIG